METTSSFVTATQKWVMNRLEDMKTYVHGVKDNITAAITALANKEISDIQALSTTLTRMADHMVTGGLKVEGSAVIDNDLEVKDHIKVNGLASAAPIVCTDPAGILIKTPGRLPTGLNSTNLTLLNERGKMARFYMRGDKLYYNYNYDKIHTYFDPGIGSELKYLQRGPVPLHEIYARIMAQPEEGNRKLAITDNFVPPPDDKYPKVRLFNAECRECFPALGTHFLIPESMYFSVANVYKINSIKILDGDGRAIAMTHDFRDMNIKELLINFPAIPKPSDTSSDEISQGIPYRDYDIHPSPITNGFTTDIPCMIQHVDDFENGYYEITDRDAMSKFRDNYYDGVIPTILLNLSKFPKDLVSVIYFEVVRAN